MKSSKETIIRQTYTSIDGANFKLTKTHCTFYLYHGDKRVAFVGRATCDSVLMRMEGEAVHSLRSMFNSRFAEHEENTAAAVTLSEHDIQRAKRLADHFLQDAVEARASCFIPGTRPAAFWTLTAAFAQA